VARRQRSRDIRRCNRYTHAQTAPQCPEVISAQAPRAVFPDATSQREKRDIYRERKESGDRKEQGKAAFVGGREASATFDSRQRATAAAAAAGAAVMMVKVGCRRRQSASLPDVAFDVVDDTAALRRASSPAEQPATN